MRDRSVKKTLAASYLFCVSLVEIIPQLQFNLTDCSNDVIFIVNTAFSQITYKDPYVLIFCFKIVFYNLEIFLVKIITIVLLFLKFFLKLLAHFHKVILNLYKKFFLSI